CERTLGDELNIELACRHLALRFRIEADMTDNQSAYQFRAHKLADTPPWSGGVVGNYREIALILPHDLIDDPVRAPNRHKAANHNACTIGYHGDGLFESNSVQKIWPSRFKIPRAARLQSVL